MKLENALKKLEKLGHTVKNETPQIYFIENEKNNLSFCRNGGENNWEAICFNVRRKTDHSDTMTDYHAGSFYPNLSQALKAFAM